jgi:hypothetical protein
MNDQIDDMRCVATISVPQLQANAASAKLENRMTAKSRTLPVQTPCGERRFIPDRPFVICAAKPAKVLLTAF